MVLKLEDKKAIVEEVAKIAASAVSAVAADYRGLTVEEMTALRVKARKEDIYLRVVRNTLARRALQDTQFACLADSLTGPLFLAFSNKELGAAAKLVRDTAKNNEHLKVKALVVSGQLYGAEQLDAIANLPTREQALSLLLSVMQAPVTRLVRTLAEPYAKLARATAQLRDKK